MKFPFIMDSPNHSCGREIWAVLKGDCKMKGYWHIVALSALVAAISVLFEWNLFILMFPWLAYLFASHRLKILPLLLSIISYLFFFYYLPQVEADISSQKNSNDSTFLQGKIIRSPIIQKNKIELVVEDDTTADKVLVIYFPDEREIPSNETALLKYGAECIVHGQIEYPEGASNPGEFDYRQFLLKKEITKQIVVHDLTDIDCVGASFWHRFIYLRQLLLHQAPENISDYTAAWVNALVLGDDSKIDPSVIRLFQDWGLSHILAISGLHIGIVVGLVYFLLIKTSAMTREKAELVVLLFLPLYAVLAGGEPSVLRASAMVVLFIILRRMKISVTALDIISVVFLLLLLFDRFIIYHIGFQFSFLVTIGIILTRKWLSLVSSSFYQVLIISFISQMVILPIQLNYFSLFQPLSILLNLVIIPYFSIFVIPFMFFFLLFSFLPESILHAFDILFTGIHYNVLLFIEWVDEYFNYPLYVSDLPVAFFICYYLCLVMSLVLVEREQLKEAFIGFSLLTLVLTGYAAAPYFSAKGTVTMLDIGQGDAFIIELPYREGVIMIDAGASFSFTDMEPSPTVYERIIKPYMRSRGIHEIDALFLSHEDLDHFGSLEFMIDDGVVKEVYVSDYYVFEPKLMQKLMDHQVPLQRIEVGSTINIQGQPFSVVSPVVDKQDANENSLVLYTEIGGRSWLFTGDISEAEELEIIKHYQVQADVIKIAHHGSNTSSNPLFLQSLQSNDAFISVGKGNSYGHPTKEVIETLEELGIRIFRTDEHGAVQYIFGKDEAWFETFLPY